MPFPSQVGDQIEPAVPGEPMRSRGNASDWLVAWHPTGAVLTGTSNGAAGVCVAENRLVLISPDELHWGFPAGRPEGDEIPEQTLRRELSEEACVDVVSARLLGFARSECVAGRDRGTVLVRSYWRAEVRIRPWHPRHEIRHRRVVPVAEGGRVVRDPDHAATRISHRALIEAGLSRVAD